MICWTVCKPNGSWTQEGERLFQFFLVNVSADSSVLVVASCAQHTLGPLCTSKISCSLSHRRRPDSYGKTQIKHNISIVLTMLIVATPNSRRMRICFLNILTHSISLCNVRPVQTESWGSLLQGYGCFVWKQLLLICWSWPLLEKKCRQNGWLSLPPKPLHMRKKLPVDIDLN